MERVRTRLGSSLIIKTGLVALPGDVKGGLILKSGPSGFGGSEFGFSPTDSSKEPKIQAGSV